jgi:N-acetylglucosaminyldiphosphoundecaprenol N-acetyl-beta-D-mannosaminyltransferase
MSIQKSESIDIFGVKVNKLSEETFLEVIRESISENKKVSIAYANADSLNKIYTDEKLRKIYNSFDLIHPDGTGVYLASEYLYGKKGLEIRLTGSDFYLKLISESIKNDWSYYFFGHTEEILEEIKKVNPGLKIAGIHEGYEFENEKVLTKINEISPDIIIIGLSCPKQEKWMYENMDKINFRVMLAVGDGIKVFAGKKIRGPEFMRKIGLEWLVRFFNNPLSNFKKYIIGIPLFIYRIIKQKLKSGLIK